MKNIPVLTVSGNSLAESYGRVLIALYEKGTRFNHSMINRVIH